jgi:diguanylate cyclase (GGDEF)-like protein
VTAGEGDVADVFQLLTYRQKYELARRRMIHDTLTGLYNRLHFDEVVPQALAHARRYEEPLSLMIIDGDHFKSINDRFSHLEGDRVLTLMGDTLGAEVRAADIACRYGGDEFVAILLPRTDAEDALALACASGAPARDVRIRVAALPVGHHQSPSASPAIRGWRLRERRGARALRRHAALRGQARRRQRGGVEAHGVRGAGDGPATHGLRVSVAAGFAMAVRRSHESATSSPWNR